MNLNDLKDLIESSVLALSTSTSDGLPNCVAVADFQIISGNQLVISDNFMNKTAINLQQNPNVAIAFWSADQTVGYQLKGTAQYLTSGPFKNIVDNMPQTQGFAHKAAVLVTVTEIWDLANPKLVYKK